MNEFVFQGGVNHDTMQDSSDDEGEMHDPYMERMKQEAAERDDDMDDDDSESEDEDFQPKEEEEVCST